MWDTAYDGCGSSPDVGVQIRYQGSAVAVFDHMTTRTPVTVLDAMPIDHVFWSDGGDARTLTARVSSSCGKVDVDVDVWIEEVA